MGGINVPIDRIVPLTDARDNFSRIVADIESSADGLYVLTKGGKPAIALVSIQYLEKLMGDNNLVTEEVKNSAGATAAPAVPQPSISATQETKRETPTSAASTPKIDPSWTGQKRPTTADDSKTVGPVSPWPIVAPKPQTPTADRPSTPAPADAGSASASTPVTKSSPPAVPPSPPLPVNAGPLPPPPPNPTANPFTVNQSATGASADKPSQIQFDQPPKTSPEPGEPLPPPSATQNANTSGSKLPNQAPSANQPAAPTSPPVQDIEI